MLKKLIKHSAFTMAGGGQATPLFGLTARRIAFTMAEILLSLTIIGVVAAITLPSLTGNINERTWNTQRKALYSRLSQAVSLMDGVRGYGTLSSGTGTATGIWGNEVDVNVYSSDNAAEAFITAGLGKVFKLNNVCDYAHLLDCGLSDTFINYGNEKITTSNLSDITGLNEKYQAFSDANGNTKHSSLLTKAAAFETANGESVLVHYNPICKSRLHNDANTSAYIETKTSLCVNFIYDLNGKKGPNTMGKDMGFMSVFYPSDPVVVAPLPHKKNLSTSTMTYQAATAGCSNLEDSRLPNLEELASMAINKIIMDEDFSESNGANGYWSASRNINEPNSAYFWASAPDGISSANLTWNKYLARCIYRN